jgi:elongation factor 1-gamma
VSLAKHLDVSLELTWQIFIRHSHAMGMIAGRLAYAKPTFTSIYEALVGRLELLNKILLNKTFLVGERITLADIFVATALQNAFTGLVDKATREKVPNVVRFFET